MTATLLVVDDNEQNRDMLSRRLVKRGYAVLTAESGARALEMVRAESVDLILLDIEMPGMTGLEVLKALRETSTRADLPVIMATARDQGEDIVEALSLGANDYVTKPLDFPVVIARVESQLSLKRAMEEIRRLAGALEIRNRFIQRTFGRYLSEEVVASLLETPEGLALGGEKREVTLLFADLRGFTAMSDRFTPEQVVRLLNNYLGTMADIITAHQGTIDEFIGDAILALFGAPVARPDDAERAAACAVAMQIAMEDVNALQPPRGAARGDDGHRGEHRRRGGREHRLADAGQVRRRRDPREPRRPHRGVHGGRADPGLGVHVAQVGGIADGGGARHLRGQGLPGPGGRSTTCAAWGAGTGCSCPSARSRCGRWPASCRCP